MKKKLRKRFTFALALMMMVVSIFTGIGTAGLTEVQAADEPAGRGTDWDILYSEIRANGSGKAYKAGTRIYMDTLAKEDGEDVDYFYIETLEGAISYGYIEATGEIDKTCAKYYEGQAFQENEIITLADTYTGTNHGDDTTITIKSGGYWIFNLDKGKGDDFYGRVASSEDEQYKDVQIPEDQLDIVQTGSSSGGSSGGSTTPSENKTITELEVNIDWTKVPNLTVGTKVGRNAGNLPSVDDIVTSNSTQVEILNCKWAVKATQEHVNNDYLDDSQYNTAAKYDHLVELNAFDENYAISADETYYGYAAFQANKGYQFSDKGGEDIISMLKGNIDKSNCFATTVGDGTLAFVFFKLGTPAEIAENNGSSSGGSSTPSEKQTIKELEVNIDWTKVPNLTVGMKKSDKDFPEVLDSICQTNSAQVSYVGSRWAVKATETNKGYLKSEDYEEAVNNHNGLAELESFSDDYVISDGDTYYGYAIIKAKDGYKFSDKYGDDVTSILTSNINKSDYFARTIYEGDGIVVYFKLGTPAEIANKKNGSSSGGNTPGGEPNNNTTTDVVVSANTPVGSVAGLEKIFETVAAEDNKGYTAADQAVVAAGGSAKIYLDAKLVTSETTGSKAATEELTKAGYQTAIALDLSVIKEIVTIAGAKTTTKLIELPALISVVSDIPEAYQGKADYCIYRNHEGAVDILTATPNADGEYIELSADGKQLILHIKKFSEYVLGYKESTTSSTPSTPANSAASTNQTAANSSASTNQAAASTTQDAQTTAAQDAQTAATATSPKTGENTSMALFVMIFALAGLGMVAVYKKAKRA